MHRRSVLAAAGVAVAGCASAEDGSRAEDSTDSPAAERGESEGSDATSTAPASPDDVAAAIVAQINAARFERSLPELGRDSTLRTAAQAHAEDMHQRDFFAHENPDGEQPWHRVPCEAAETIYDVPLAADVEIAGEPIDTTTVRGAAGAVVGGWVASEGHRAIMLDERIERIGVGVAPTGEGRYLVAAKYC